MRNNDREYTPPPKVDGCAVLARVIKLLNRLQHPRQGKKMNSKRKGERFKNKANNSTPS